MRGGPRKTAPRVRDGKVAKKNNWELDRADYHVRSQAEIALDRRDPGPACRHLLTIGQLREAIALLPDWDELAVGLDAVVLDRGGGEMGWYRLGVVAVCAWEHDLWWRDADPDFLLEHAAILEALGVEVVKHGPRTEVRWTEPQARAFQVLHILPHELGHHRDLMTTQSRRAIARGEPYAEAYAHRAMDEMLPAYATRFGL